jgi:hypothetical protein
MEREQLKQHLWKLRCMLDELEQKAEPVSMALCLHGKGNAVHHYLQMFEIQDAVAAYKRLDEDQQRWFHKAINEGETK